MSRPRPRNGPPPEVTWAIFAGVLGVVLVLCSVVIALIEGSWAALLPVLTAVLCFRKAYVEIIRWIDGEDAAPR